MRTALLLLPALLATGCGLTTQVRPVGLRPLLPRHLLQPGLAHRPAQGPGQPWLRRARLRLPRLGDLHGRGAHEPGLLEDSRAALAWLSARAGVPADRLVYYGRSSGSAVATQLAAHAPPAALVLESPFTSVQGLVRDSSNMDLPAGFFAEGSWDTEGRVRSLQGVPLLLLHGTADDFIRPEFSERLFSVAHEPKQLVLVEGADHDNVPQLMGVDYAPTLGAFLEGTRTQL